MTVSTQAIVRSATSGLTRASRRPLTRWTIGGSTRPRYCSPPPLSSTSGRVTMPTIVAARSSPRADDSGLDPGVALGVEWQRRQTGDRCDLEPHRGGRRDRLRPDGVRRVRRAKLPAHRRRRCLDRRLLHQPSPLDPRRRRSSGSGRGALPDVRVRPRNRPLHKQCGLRGSDGCRRRRRLDCAFTSRARHHRGTRLHRRGKRRRADNERAVRRLRPSGSPSPTGCSPS